MLVRLNSSVVPLHCDVVVSQEQIGPASWPRRTEGSGKPWLHSPVQLWSKRFNAIRVPSHLPDRYDKKVNDLFLRIVSLYSLVTLRADPCWSGLDRLIFNKAILWQLLTGSCFLFQTEFIMSQQALKSEGLKTEWQDWTYEYDDMIPAWKTLAVLV